MSAAFEEQVINAVRDNLSELQVQAIDNLIKKSKELVTVKDSYGQVSRELSQKNSALSVANGKLDDAKNEIIALKKTISDNAEEVMEARINERANHIIDDDRSKLFEIIGNAYKHYTHTTQGHVVQRMPGYSELDANGNAVSVPGGDIITPTTTTTTSE